MWKKRKINRRQLYAGKLTRETNLLPKKRKKTYTSGEGDFGSGL
jgi:hypothetical protein